HYFKWVLPILALYAVLLVLHLLRRTRPRALLAAAVVLAIVLPWRAAFVPAPELGDARFDGPNTVLLPNGLPAAGDAVLFAASGAWDTIYQGHHTFDVAGHRWYGNSDIKALPVPGGLLLITLRSFPHAPAVVTFDPGVTLNATVPPIVGRERVSFGLPCLIPRAALSCEAVTAAP